MAQQKFVSHTVDGKRISHQSYFSHYGADQIIADRFRRDTGKLDPFVRNGTPIESTSEDGDTFTYQKR